MTMDDNFASLQKTLYVAVFFLGLVAVIAVAGKAFESVKLEYSNSTTKVDVGAKMNKHKHNPLK
jgi:hypothetical protein